MGTSSRIVPILGFHTFFVLLYLQKLKKIKDMKTSELQSQLDGENLNFLNYILAKMFNVELQGYVYSEED